MRGSLDTVAVLLVIAGFTGLAAAQRTEVDQLVSEADPAIQELCNRTWPAFVDELGDVPDRLCDSYCEVRALEQQTEDKFEIVKQLAIFVVTTTSKEDVHVFGAVGILRFLDLPPSISIYVLAPYLDSGNEKLRWFAGLWFINHDKSSEASTDVLRPVNYHEYMEYVGNRLARSEEIPAGFIEYIYERHPGKALLVFAYASKYRDLPARLQAMRKAFEARQRGQEPQGRAGQQWEERRKARLRERREIELAERIVSNAIWLNENEFAERFQAALPEATAELAKLAKHEAWWARLYVAWIMRRHPELRQPAVVQQLAEDPDPLVSEAANAIRQ